MKTTPKGLATRAVLLSITFGFATAWAQAGGVADYVAMLGVLQNVRQNLDSVLNTANQAASDRISQSEIAVDHAISRLQETIKQVQNGVSVQREEVFKQAFDALANVNDTIQNASRSIYLSTNSTLVSGATIAGAIPGINVPDFVFAADPLRMKSDAKNRLVSFYGYFPSVEKDGDATVSIGDSTLPLKRYAGNRLAFDLPPSLLGPSHQSTYIDMSIMLPRLHWYSWSHPVVHNRIYVQPDKPFSFEIQVWKENPDLWLQIDGARYDDRADSSKTSVAKSMTAVELFSKLVNDDTHYQMDSAQLVTVKSSIGDAGNKPCDCCDASSGKLDRWDPSGLAYSLSAPTCGAKMCSLTYHCGGGGSNVEIYITPTFRVKRRGVQAALLEKTETRLLTRSAADSVALNPVWQSLHITMRFADGDDQAQSAVDLTKDVPVATDGTGLFSAKVDANNQLTVTIRQ